MLGGGVVRREDFPVQVGKGIGGEEGLEDEAVGGDGRRVRLDEHEACEERQVSEDLGDDEQGGEREVQEGEALE